ncbi:hypothetical protein JL722_5187 [Aureococcus anophagefferens]|nr:hypothetical protein JL722_5187 [Aureococcus anophagefferens]
MCGNLGLLLVGHDGDAAPEALLEEMARVVAMRGAQSYGFVAAAGGKSMTMHKAVLTKRDDIATALRRAVRRRKLLSTTSLDARERAAVAEAALRGYSEWDLRSAVWRFLKTAHGAFGLCATTSLAPGAVVLGSVKQPLIVGVGRGFVAYASERAAVHVGAVGAALKYRYVLAEGDVVSIAPEAAEQGTLGGSGCRLALARVDADAAVFRDLESTDLCDAERNALMMRPLPGGPPGDVVGDDLRDLPVLASALARSFRLDTSPNAAAARAFAKAVFDADRMRRSSLDVVVVAVEASLWVAEQWAANARAACPVLRVVVASANKALAALTACESGTHGGATSAHATVFPSGDTPARRCRGAVALAVSHSGQTFPTLNAARALRDAGADVFVVAGSLDVQLAEVVKGGQSFRKGARRSKRVLVTGAGVRLAEAASLTTALTHVLLTELLLALAAKAPRGSCLLRAGDVKDLETLADACVHDHLPNLCPGPAPRPSRDAHAGARALGERWADHVLEPLACFVLATAYVLVSVTAGTPLVTTAVFYSCGYRSPAVAALDALLYAFFPVVAALVLRFVQKRTMLARFGRRTIMVLDVPMVHQCAVAFGQKLFGLSYGLNGVDFAGANPRGHRTAGRANPADHGVHRMLHRVVRGTLVALGVPDGRLKALVDVECAAYLTALQLKSLSNWGVGAELATVGHHSYVPGVVDAALIFDAFQRPVFLSEVHHASPRAPDARRLSFLEAPEARFGAVGPGVVAPRRAARTRGRCWRRTPSWRRSTRAASRRWSGSSPRVGWLNRPARSRTASDEKGLDDSRRSWRDLAARAAAPASARTVRVRELDVSAYAALDMDLSRGGTPWGDHAHFAAATALAVPTAAPSAPSSRASSPGPGLDLDKSLSGDAPLSLGLDLQRAAPPAAPLPPTDLARLDEVNSEKTKSRDSLEDLDVVLQDSFRQDPPPDDDTAADAADAAAPATARTRRRPRLSPARRGRVSAPKRAAAARLPHVDAAAGLGRAQDDRRWRGPRAAPSAMARATVALTPQIQKRMDVLSKVFEGWEEDCMNCKAFAASLADWTTPKGAEVIREGEDAAQPQLLICESGAAEVFVTTTTKSGAKKQKRVARLVAPFYVGEGQVIARSVPTATIKAAQDLAGSRWTSSRATSYYGRTRSRSASRAHTYNDGLFFGNIDNAAFFAAFEAFAKRTFCAENVVFLRGYRDLQTETDAAAAVARVERLFRDHVDVDASDADNLAVNVSQKVVRESKKNFAAAREADDVAALRTVFDKCAEEINQMLTKDIIPNFMNGDEYRAYLLGAWPLPKRPPKRRSTACGLM